MTTWKSAAQRAVRFSGPLSTIQHRYHSHHHRNTIYILCLCKFIVTNHVPYNISFRFVVSGTTLLVSFSLTRNWYRLIGDSNDEVARDLRAINAIKFLFMYGIVLAHVGVFTSVSPIANPQFMENVCPARR